MTLPGLASIARSAERAKTEQISLFFPLRPGGHAAGTSPSPSPTSKGLLFIPQLCDVLDYILAAVPLGAAQD